VQSYVNALVGLVVGMPKMAEEKTAVWCRKISKPGLHAVGGVSGLLLRVADTGAKYWVMRVRVKATGKRRDIGIGPFPEIGLAQARDRARELKEQIRAGVDPVAEKARAMAEQRAEVAKLVTFDEAVKRMLADREAEWSAKHRQQWRNTLETYAGPVIGDLPVAAIELAHVLEVLRPIWSEKTETASRVRGRIEAVLDWARVHGYRSGENPARWKGNLDAVLPKPGKIATVVHHPALPWREMPGFMAELRKREGMGARALEFVILTAARSGEVRGATWDEIDLERRLWTIPAARMKAGREHVVPLSDAAVAMLKALGKPPKGGLVFPAAKGGKLSDMTLSAVLRRMDAGCVPHGFRSSFRDWAAEATGYPAEIAEMALAHNVGNAVERAYRRGDMLEKRRRLMDDWARHCNGEKPAGGEVVAIGGRR
jgi:integrase